MSVTVLAQSSLPGCAAWRLRLTFCAVLLVLTAPSASPQRSAAEQDKPTVLSHRYRAEGIALLEQRKIQEAMARFRSAVEVDPADAVSHAYIGVILADQGLTAGAIDEFQRAIGIDANLDLAHYHLAVAYFKSGRTLNAIDEYQQALGLKPDFTPARFGLSAACWKVGDLDGAIQSLQQVAATNPQFWEARYNLGLALWQRYRNPEKLPQKTDLEEAIRQLREAMQQRPEQAKVHLALGQILAETQDPSGAVDILRKAVALAPNDPAYGYNLGVALRQRADLDGAEAEFRKALLLDPQYVPARRALGQVLRQKGDLPAAAVELGRAASQQPDDAEIHRNLGAVLLGLNDTRRGIDELRHAVALDPYYSEARLILAQALQKTGQAEEARKERDEAQRIDTLRSNRGRAVVLLQAAEGLMQAGGKAKALADLRQAVELSPDFPEAYFQLAVALDRSSAPLSEIAGALRKAIEIDPGHAPAHYQLGLVYKKQGMIEQEQAELRSALKLAPSLSGAHLAMAETAVENRDWPRAVDEYVRYLAWKPNDEVVRRALAIARSNLTRP